MVRGLRALLAAAAGLQSFGQTDYLFSIFAIINVAMNAFVVGRVSARLGDRTMSNVGLACLVAGFALVPFIGQFARAFGNDDAALRLRHGADEHRNHGAHQQYRLRPRSRNGARNELFTRLAFGYSRTARLDRLLGLYGPRFAGVESLGFAAIALGMGLRSARIESGERRTDESILTLEAETAKIADG